MAQQHQDDQGLQKPAIRDRFSYKSVQILRSKPLGLGSYGTVYRAICDDLQCAAKVLHPTLFNSSPLLQQRSSERKLRQPMERFFQECEILGAIRHPNIVQYLCTHKDPETGQPALLMELMDDNLTHFLSISSNLFPLHLQINFCHDIALALSFLHRNGILHRDLSSNNVLLIANKRAKVADFGMTRIIKHNPRTSKSYPLRPGTAAYMPPEVMDANDHTDKIDCFSFGVLIIQILTRKQPSPGKRFKKLDSLQLLAGTTSEICVPEIERRSSDINKIDPQHPLLAIALDCLKDDCVQRPTATELCRRIVPLKEEQEYRASVVLEETQMNGECHRTCQQENQQLRQKLEIAEHLLRDKDRIIQDKETEIQRLEMNLCESEQTAGAFQSHCDLLEKKLDESEKNIEVFLKRLAHLECENQAQQAEQQLAEHKLCYSLSWKTGTQPMKAMSRCTDAVVSKKVMYCSYMDDNDTQFIATYNMAKDTWELMLKCPHNNCSIVVILNRITTVGGIESDKPTNKLLCLDGRPQWLDLLPPMPTPRSHTSSTVCGSILIVVGGKDIKGVVRAVELLNVDTQQWTSANSVPQPLTLASAVVYNNRVYILGGIGVKNEASCTVFAAPIEALVTTNSRGRRFFKLNPWRKLSDSPLSSAAFVVFHDQLLSIGGYDGNNLIPSNAVYKYNVLCNIWEKIGEMPTTRYHCIAGVHSDIKVVVVGGCTSNPDTEPVGKLSCVEIASCVYEK